MITDLADIDHAEAEAETMLARVLPDIVLRRQVVRQLLVSVDTANAIAPDAWAVTMFKDGFRLNVGQVEAVILGGGMLRLNILGTKGAESLIGDQFIEASYRSMSRQICAFLGTPEQFALLPHDCPAVLAHLDFVVEASKTSTGRPRSGTPFRRSHCPGLMSYARRFSAKPCVSPATFDEWQSSDEVLQPGQLFEGSRVTIQVNAFERNATARRQCIEHYGTSCVCCGFNFGAVYGSAGAGFIHIHHLRPLSSIGETYQINVVDDLRPVCANCHAIIHRRTPPYSIDEVREFLSHQSYASNPE